MDGQEEQNQLRYLYSAYTQEYEMIVSQINNYISISGAFARNIEALEKIKSMENTGMLVALEGGTFVEVGTKSISKVITNVGAGYMVEKGIDDAKQFVGANASKIEHSLSELLAQKQHLEKEIVEISRRINAQAQEHAH